MSSNLEVKNAEQDGELKVMNTKLDTIIENQKKISEQYDSLEERVISLETTIKASKIVFMIIMGLGALGGWVSGFFEYAAGFFRG